MKKEVIIVPKDKSLLEILAELKERITNAWIYIHANVIGELRESCDRYQSFVNTSKFSWTKDEKNPETSIWVIETMNVWSFVTEIEANDIDFNRYNHDPDEIFFLQMEE